MKKILSRYFVKNSDVEVIFVVSSNLHRLAYSASRQVLQVQFKRGAEYRYYGVSPRIYNALKRAGSHGRFFYYAIRLRYAYIRL